ncbi:MAG: insulinase family protein [Bacteroidales bacterium]|nr:insulinase family protein [Bacteroidales bacterium]
MYQYHTLPNGIRIIFRQTESAVAYSAVYVNVGSRDEAGQLEGMAHFIEHSLFKGTTHRRASHILNRIDGVGGELNAFTTKEETCIYASSLSQHLDRCLELFADILFHSTFPEAEIEKEREVVIEEIDSYRDSPADLIYDEYEELAFQGHPLAHNILGTKRNVRHFTPDMIRQHLQSNYTTSRMAISVVGNTTMERLVRMCEKYFGGYSSQAPQRAAQPPAFRQFDITRQRRTHQSHIIVGCEAPNLYDTAKTAFTLLCNILGGPAMNSRLNVAVRERHGFCYNIESQYTLFSDTGLLCIYAGVDRDARERALQLIRRELQRLVDTPLTASQLRAAQLQLIGQMAISNDNALNEMQSIGKACLVYGTVDPLADTNRHIMAVTQHDIQSLAARYLAPGKISTLCYV